MSTHPHTNLFTQVDRTKDPDFFVRFMDEAQKPRAIQASKRLMLERIALTPGAAVLDVGCGPGTDVFDMVELVGPTGRLIGLDASEVMLAEARRRARAFDVPITYEVGEVQALPSRTARSTCAAPNDCWSTSPMPGGRSQRWCA